MGHCNCKICKIEISNLKAQIMNLVTKKTRKQLTCGGVNDKKPKRMTLNQLVGIVENIVVNLNQLAAKVDNLATTVDNLTTTMNNRFDAIEKRLDSLEERVTNLEIKVDQIDKRVAYLEQNVVMKDDLKKIFKPSAFKNASM